MKRFLIPTGVVALVSLILSSCALINRDKDDIRLPSPNIEGTLCDYASVSDGLLKFDNGRPSISVTIKNTKKIDPNKYTTPELSGANGTGGDPTLAILDASGNLITGGEMHVADQQDLAKIRKTLTDEGYNEVTVRFVANDMTSQELDEMAEKASKMEFRADVKLTPKSGVSAAAAVAPQRVPVAAPPAAAGSQIRVNGVNVRLRWSPSYSGTIYTNSYGVPIYPYKGQILPCSGTVGDWYQVVFNGHTLYINRYYSYPV